MGFVFTMLRFLSLLSNFDPRSGSFRRVRNKCWRSLFLFEVKLILFFDKMCFCRVIWQDFSVRNCNVFKSQETLLWFDTKFVKCWIFFIFSVKWAFWSSVLRMKTWILPKRSAVKVKRFDTRFVESWIFFTFSVKWAFWASVLRKKTSKSRADPTAQNGPPS